MKKSFYLILASICLLGAIFSAIKGNELGFGLSILSVLMCIGFQEITYELRKSNESVIVRDPKTGRFVRK